MEPRDQIHLASQETPKSHSEKIFRPFFSSAFSLSYLLKVLLMAMRLFLARLTAAKNVVKSMTFGARKTWF